MDFAEFYRESRDACLCSVLVSVGDRDVAQDLVDEAFARAWASWWSVSRHPAPAAWVVRTALNASISRWRRRRREVSLPDPGQVWDLAAGNGAADSPLDPRIMAALARLPARQRQVVTLRLLLDLDTSRTAEALGISPSAVKAHLARAIAVLRSDLMPEREQENSS
jgi:RNA polymerase sigma factor (sigma-70 family)